jgi:hypothetical protein
LGNVPVVVAFTNPIPVTGVYYINASALLIVQPGDRAFCYVTLKSDPTNDGLQGGGSNEDTLAASLFAQASIADSRVVFADDAIQLTCYSQGSSDVGPSGVQNASITAILINSSFAAKKKARHLPTPPVPGGPANTK